MAPTVLKNGTELTIKLTKRRRASAVKSISVQRGREFEERIVKTFKDDVIATNVHVTVKSCTAEGGQKVVNAELDMILRDKSVYELKNWATIGTYDARKMIGQVDTQIDVIKQFSGNHAGLIVSDRTRIVGAAAEAFEQEGKMVYQEGEALFNVGVSVSK